MVQPNPINWSAVASGFSDPSQNPLVFSFVLTTLGLYVVVLVWVRKADKRDEEKVSETASFIARLKMQRDNIYRFNDNYFR